MKKVADGAKGAACLVASAFGFALMAFFVRLCDDLGGPVGTFQKSFFRNAVALAVAGVLFARRRAGGGSAPLSGIGAAAWGLLLARSAFGAFGILCNFHALGQIPIAEAMTLNKTAPFFTVLFSWLAMREKMSRRSLLCLAAAFAGAVLVMKPGFRGAGTFAAACALCGGIGAGAAYACVRALGRMKVDGAFIVLFFSAFSCLVSLPAMVAAPAPMTPAQLLVMTGAGAGAAIGQFGVTAAYRYARPADIAAFDFTGVVFTALLGFAFFSQTPDALSVAGFAAIVLAALLSQARAREPRRRTARAIVSLGSNIEPRREYLARAVAALSALPGTVLSAQSETIETEGVDVPAESAHMKFLNQAAIFETTLDVREFSRLMHSVEDSLGRVRTVRNGPRTIDIDLVDFDGMVLDEPGLTLPHPRAKERAFVMEPLLSLGIEADDLGRRG